MMFFRAMACAVARASVGTHASVVTSPEARSSSRARSMMRSICTMQTLPRLRAPSATARHALQSRIRIDRDGDLHALEEREIGDRVAVERCVVEHEAELFAERRRERYLAVSVAKW